MASGWTEPTPGRVRLGVGGRGSWEEKRQHHAWDLCRPPAHAQGPLTSDTSGVWPPVPALSNSPHSSSQAGPSQFPGGVVS